MNARILIADDEPHIRNVLQLKLRQAGFAVVLASDGEEALRLAQECRPDALISDYQMPLLNGLELCRKLQSVPSTSGIPAILLTSRDFDVDSGALSGTSIRQVIGKPFSPRQIIAALGTMLEPSCSTHDAAR